MSNASGLERLKGDDLKKTLVAVAADASGDVSAAW
jgi:hypothetical protein